MPPTEPNDQDRKLAPRRTANRLIAALLLVAVGFSAVCVAFLIDTRRTAWNSARDATASLVAALELDILLNIESFDLSLQAVVDNVDRPEIGQMAPDLRQLQPGCAAISRARQAEARLGENQLRQPALCRSICRH